MSGGIYRILSIHIRQVLKHRPHCNAAHSVATQQVEEGKGQRWIAERFQLDCEQVPGTTTNALFADHPHNAPDVCSASREVSPWISSPSGTKPIRRLSPMC